MLTVFSLEEGGQSTILLYLNSKLLNSKLLDSNIFISLPSHNSTNETTLVLTTKVDKLVTQNHRLTRPAKLDSGHSLFPTNLEVAIPASKTTSKSTTQQQFEPTILDDFVVKTTQNVYLMITRSKTGSFPATRIFSTLSTASST